MHLESIVIVNKFMKEVFIKNYNSVMSKGDLGDRKEGIHITGDDTMIVSDGYHTFDELYDHRVSIFIALCMFLSSYNKFFRDNKVVAYQRLPWRSKLHSDGTMYEGYFILGINKEPGYQMTYHVPMERWKDTEMIETLPKAPEWDGHTPAGVLERLKHI